MKNRFSVFAALFFLLGGLFVSAPDVRGEVMVQYFNTSWKEITARIPELAEAGYTSLWIPPPTKATSSFSTGYDEFDAFDLGSKDQEGSVSTFYGTQDDLINLITTAHRFGMRVYLDNVMNHRGFQVPGYDAFTSINTYPGMVPEDFHLQTTQDGFYRNWPGISNYSDQWQVWNLSTSNLVDIAQEPGTTNLNFGFNEGDTHTKISFVRQPNNPEYYDYLPNGTYVGFGANNGITTQIIAQNPAFYSEYVQDFLNRAARWELDITKADGFRLDAVKHVRDDFFGAEFGSDKNSSTYGYLGQIALQFNLTRGFSDSNHRASTFNTEVPRDTPMFFGEHLGGTPQQPYIDAGMRLVDNALSSTLNGDLPTGPLNGLDGDGGGGLPGGSGVSVSYAQSADNGYAVKRQLQYAFMLTRAGLPEIYTDGYNEAQVFAGTGSPFPANADSNFLGQFSDGRIPNLLYIHNQFSRSVQIGKWSDNSTVVYERQDKRENPSMTDADGTVLLFMMNGNSSAGLNPSSSFTTTFPAGSYLWQYATGAADNGDSMSGFYYTVPSNQQVSDLIIPKGGYFAFSWRTPEQSNIWKNGGGKPITILDNGQPVQTMTYLRKDGVDGDPNFNPYGVTGAVAGSYSYPMTVPLITSGTNLSFLARADGSAENILMELDGGVDLNSQMTGFAKGGGKDERDNPPGLTTDVFLGYEQTQFVDRQYPEKFAAKDSTRDQIGSAGAETYTTTVGSGTVSITNGPTGANSSFDSQGGTVASFVFHDPASTVDGISGSTPTQYTETGNGITLWAKTNAVGAGFRMYVYYTTDGSFPEGAGGVGLGTAKTAVMTYDHNAGDGNNWWTATITPKPSGQFIYKMGMFRDQDSPNPTASVFPSGATQVAQKLNMMTTFQITGFNATTTLVKPHNDYGVSQNGLSQGFHILRSRQFLKRAGRSSIYNTSVLTFYYDTQLPQGQIVFPANNGDSIGGQQYGVVVRADQSVTEVDYKIDDGDSTNDDANTGVPNGNGAWVKATNLTENPTIQSAYPNEWRFNYVNIPSSGNATISVRLRKLSSSTDNTLSDAAGHFTTLTRNVATNGPVIKMFVAFPQADAPGDTTLVDSNYVLKVWFSNSLGQNTSTQDLINQFLITIASSESGSPENPVTQGRANYSINYNVGPGGAYDELQYQLPNLYNGQPDFLHTITVTYTNPPSIPLVATRLVKARPVVAIADNIINPPQFDADGNPYQIVLPDVASPTAAQRSIQIQVQTDASATGVALSFTQGNVNPGDIVPNSANPVINGNNATWNFTWNNIQQGPYQFTSTVTEGGSNPGTATASRSGTVVYRELVTATAGKLDNDDDGIPDDIESTAVPLPTTDPDVWTNDQIHRWAISGKTNPLSPDTDGDNLPDGLELGLSSPMADSGTTSDTNTSASTNGTALNFQSDLDPPIYNTTDNSGSPSGQDYSYYNPWPYNINNSRTDQIAGTMTDPTKSDTDSDGLSDGVEDLTYIALTGTLDANGHAIYHAVHNGRVDIIPGITGLQTVIAHPPTVYNTSQIDRSKVLAKSAGAQWLETDPNNADTTGNGLSDGTKDVNHNGIVDLAIIDRNQTDGNGNFVVLATMNNVLTPVTVQGSASGAQSVKFYYLDFCYQYLEPTDGKTYTSTCLDKSRLNAMFRPGGQVRSDGLDVVWLETDPRRYSTSGDGLPDGWKVQYGLNPFDDGVIGDYNLNTGKLITNTNNGPNGNPAGDGVTNLQKFLNGDNPNVSVNAPPPPSGSFTIGPGNPVTVGAVTNNHEFSEWTSKDLISLDYYDGDGVNYNGGDVYHANDGFDTSRDMVAFYAHDGGDTANGGDGKVYFRADFLDLLPYAEGNNLNVYVAINFGNPGTGEYNLPDNLRTGTKMGWQAVVACYKGNFGNVYLWNPSSATHSTAIGQDLSQFGVTARNQTTANGFGQAYFDSTLSACDFSISRQALKDAGWDGVDASKLIYEVYTTDPCTVAGSAGDIGWRSNIRDTFYDDWIASDYYADQINIAGNNSVLKQWAGMQAHNDNGKRIKVISLIHGNETIQPGSYIQNLVNTGSGAGLYRPLDVHQAYNVPLTMHITPTLASAIQWAKADPSSAQQYVDGPALNTRIASMVSNGQIDMVGSTFSDHMLNYFDTGFNADNVSLANEFLTNIYQQAPSSNVLWLPERVANSNVLAQVGALGYNYTFVDQSRHIFKWFGRQSSLDDDAYRINSINGTKVFVINDTDGQYLFQNETNGLPILIRQLLGRKAQDGQQDQVVIFENDWESFANKANADAYDKNIRWMAQHPWIDIVTPDQIIQGKVDTSVPPTGSGTQWGTVNRGTSLSLPSVSKDWIDHASNENFDNWYFGTDTLHESLATKLFNIRTGDPMPTAFGLESGSNGIVSTAWSSVTSLSGSNAMLNKLARATIHSSVFETAFHNESNTDLDKFSTGAYISPNTDFNTLSTISTYAQSQSRKAAVYKKVDAWASSAAAGAYNTSSVAEQVDVDLDGEPEYLIYNDRMFALFEAIGGRLTHAWVRDINTNQVLQVVGNPAGYSGWDTEEEGYANLGSATGQLAYRTSAFKDWFATGASNASGYVNNLYTVTAAPGGNGWTFTSSDGAIAKTITLTPRATTLSANYTLAGGITTLYVRFGMSPNLYDLLLNGQTNLSTLDDQTNSEISVIDNNSVNNVRTFIKYGGGTGLSASYNRTAVDVPSGTTFNMVNMRNQAQTQQLEIFNPPNTTGMSFQLGFQTGQTVSISTENDGIPDWWKQKYGFSVTDPTVAGSSPEGDGLTNLQKYIVGANPTVPVVSPINFSETRNGQGNVTLQFSTIQDRIYRIYYTANLNAGWTQAGGDVLGTGSGVSWTDDGSQTGTAPGSTSRRFYKVSVSTH